MIKGAIKKVTEGYDLMEQETYQAMKEIMEGEASDAQISSFLTALSMKGESVDEIFACAKVMREKAHSIRVPTTAVDLCGTGGDGLGTFNVSTISSLVVAGTDVPVAKHGNRSVSSRSGSADLMECLGVDIELDPSDVERCIRDIGIGFMFAPNFHGAMKHAIGPRRQIGIRTLFNLLGPLTNPGDVNHQLLGVYEESLTDFFAEVLKKFGVEHALVVHGSGLDELTITGRNKITEVKRGSITSYHLVPEELGFNRSEIDEIKAGSVARNVEIADSVLDGDDSPYRHMVLLNAGASLYAADRVKDMEAGVELAKKSIDSGRAKEKLDELIDHTKGVN
ncbi:MAG: anthranilate phosphoribosyltransferase [Candidatus Saliniplasma sp.]